MLVYKGVRCVLGYKYGHRPTEGLFISSTREGAFTQVFPMGALSSEPLNGEHADRALFVGAYYVCARDLVEGLEYEIPQVMPPAVLHKAVAEYSGIQADCAELMRLCTHL